MKPLLIAAALALAPLPALAMMAPQYYQQARAEAPDVIVLRIDSVRKPTAAMGVCEVTGRVTRVERGRRYAVGQVIVVPVHCARPNADYPDGGTIWTQMARLKPGVIARAFLKDGKPALDAFDIL